MPILIATASPHPDRPATTGAGNAPAAPAGAVFSALLRSSAASEAGAGAVATDPAAYANQAGGAADARAAVRSTPIDAAQRLHAAAIAAAPRQPAPHGVRNRAADRDLPPRTHPAGNRHAARAVEPPPDAKATNLLTLPPVAPGEEPGSASATADPPAGSTGIDPALVAAGAGQAAAAAAALLQRIGVAGAATADAAIAAAGQAQAAASVAAQRDDGAAITAGDASQASAPVAQPQVTDRARATAGHSQVKASIAAAGARAMSRPLAAAGDARAAAAVDAPGPAGPAGSAEIAATDARRSSGAIANASGARAAEDAAAAPDAAAQTVAAMMTMPMQSAGDEEAPADTGRAASPGVRRLGADRPSAAGNARPATSSGDGQPGADAGASAPITAAGDPPPRALAIDAPAQRPAAAVLAGRLSSAAAIVASEPVRERGAFDPGADGASTPQFPASMVAGAAGTTAADKAATTPTERPSVREARIAAAVGDPGFAPAIGATLATLTREGVQHARLQLHPAEMGPITVQIALDGQSARVDFHAAVAATRQALESALPALAGALRESGLTLTGGGVFQQSPGRQGADRQPGDRGGMAQDRIVDEMPAASPRTIARRGLVDLVA